MAGLNPLRRGVPDVRINAPESIKLDGLTLRRLRMDDAEAVYTSYARDPEVTRWLTFKTHDHVDHATEYCAAMQNAWEAGEVFCHALVDPADDTLFGTIDMRIDGFHAAFGYAMARDRWGRGYASRALKALVDFALDQPTIYRAWAFCDAENGTSARVMEKAGMTFEGVLHRWHVAQNLSPEPRDCFAYAKVR
ncbi:MAG: GNAT family N-acetyltransferase [Alphaproteobacteria bacterium]|nr:GNAT family N-acetyltransferase [Alphaproteobacteria bacterium]